MKYHALRIWLAILLLALPVVACQRTPGFDDRLNEITAPYRFSIARWELQHLVEWAKPAERSLDSPTATQAEVETVREYFRLNDEIRLVQWQINAIAAGNDREDLAAKEEELEKLLQRREAMKGAVRWVLGRQVREAFSAQGIFNPLDRFIQIRISFPPLNFRLARPPHLLVISPRERIESLREIMLVQELDLETIEDLEARVDALGVSSLVTELGGFGATYPAFVADDASLGWTIATVAEEWLHQYLVFTPLGFMYLLDSLGVARNYEVATMNETLAGMVSDEIAQIVLDTYYRPKQPAPTPQPETRPTPEFDFHREMRQIRLTVDELLAKGEVEKAEQFMEERRQYLASKGYYIRKLNQAYFAFHGTYADEPTSVSPIGAEMRELRKRSASLREFLNRAAAMTNRQDLLRSITSRRGSHSLFSALAHPDAACLNDP